MQKWDYATIGLLNSYGLQYKLNGDKQNQWKDHPLHEVLHDMGEQGWELISYDGENYLFKRPKVGNTAPAPAQQHAAHGGLAAHVAAQHGVQQLAPKPLAHVDATAVHPVQAPKAD